MDPVVLGRCHVLGRDTAAEEPRERRGRRHGRGHHREQHAAEGAGKAGRRRSVIMAGRRGLAQCYIMILFLLLAIADPCTDANGCGLAGICRDGSCVCDPWAKGRQRAEPCTAHRRTLCFIFRPRLTPGLTHLLPPPPAIAVLPPQIKDHIARN